MLTWKYLKVSLVLRTEIPRKEYARKASVEGKKATKVILKGNLGSTEYFGVTKLKTLSPLLKCWGKLVKTFLRKLEGSFLIEILDF